MTLTLLVIASALLPSPFRRLQLQRHVRTTLGDASILWCDKEMGTSLSLSFWEWVVNNADNRSSVFAAPRLTAREVGQLAATASPLLQVALLSEEAGVPSMALLDRVRYPIEERSEYSGAEHRVRAWVHHARMRDWRVGASCRYQHGASC